MSRILLADDSPHAQRMGERILREEGFEVVTVTDGETAMIRLADVDPDIVMADVFLPHKSGYEICRYVKSHPRHRHARVILLAGLLEPLDESEVSRVRADAVLKKPFEASAVIETVKPLAEAAAAAREAALPAEAAATEPEPVPPKAEPAAELEPKPDPLHADPDRVRAAVTLALDQATPALIEEITARVLIALGH
jgi:CheY-like chemotaxis protein